MQRYVLSGVCQRILIVMIMKKLKNSSLPGPDIKGPGKQVISRIEQGVLIPRFAFCR